MASSQGNGGRSSGAVLNNQSDKVLSGFTTGIARVVSGRGAPAKPIPGLVEGLLKTLVTSDGVFVHTGTKSPAFVDKARKWAKEAGVVVHFTAPQTNDDGTITRGAWAEITGETPPATRQIIDNLANAEIVASDEK